MSHRSSLPFLICLLAAGFSVPALAKEDAASPAKPAPKESAPHRPAKAAAPADPRIATTGFGAWALRCRKPPAKSEKDAKADRACEISETIEAQDRSGPIAKLSIGQPGGTGALHAIVILPNNVSFPSSVHIRSDDKDIWGVRLDWVRCIPGGCFAETLLADATVAHWHDLDTTGDIVFTDSTGEQITLPMSFKGFGQAIDALKKSE
ncbi:MAG TPA: invasion associated locus B family protein [Methylovirgula sp.]